MKLLENIMLALSSLRAGKMRALLTMLGIIIGIGSVIAIVTVGNSLTVSINDMVDEMGANQIQIQIYARESDSNWIISDEDFITQDMVDEMVALYGGQIDSVLAQEGVGTGQAKKGRAYSNVEIVGVAEGGVESAGADIIMGRDISPRDLKSAKNVAVVSDRLLKTVLPREKNPLGKEVQIHTKSYGILNFTIIGVYEFKLSAMMSNFVSDEDISSNLLIPLTTAKRINGSQEGFYYFAVKTATGADSFALTETLSNFFEKKYERNPNTTVIVNNMESFLNEMMGVMNNVSLAIAIIAAISLLVGGIGVMNIMLVSVTERTREIGTRKALGARSSAIRFQFIIESMIICLIGGIIGIGLGLLLGSLGSALLGFPASPSVPIIVIAVVFSMAIGVFFGFYPANKAAKLDPIEALRYE